jgi:probable phosphomutase (TIGR03848 family)
MAYVLLVRHGQNDWVDKKRLAGWTPGVHLNDEGRKQVKALADRLSQLPVKAIYSSPLERCMETAEAVAISCELPVNTLEAIGEVRYGKWEGKKLKKLVKKRKRWSAVQHFPSRFRFPDGESFLEVQQRAVEAVETLNGRYKDKMIVLVSHADVIKLMLAHYLGMHIDAFQRIVIAPASVSILALEESGHLRVIRVNDDGPLRARKAENGTPTEQEGEDGLDSKGSIGRVKAADRRTRTPELVESPE